MANSSALPSKLRPTSNAYSFIEPLMPRVNEVLRSIRPGDVVQVPA